MRSATSAIAAVCAAAVALWAGVGQAGPKWEISQDSWMQMSFLGQVQASHQDGASDEDDFYLRRGRIILSGQLMDGVKMFAETDNDNAGRNGYSDVSTDIQDAFVDVRLGQSEHWTRAGLILLPFSFETRSSAASLLGLDYNADAIKLVNTFTWRDYGVESHGHFGKRLSYRTGVFDGYDSRTGNKNADADFRYTGHVAFNVVGEAETDTFYTQERLGKKGPYVSLGLGGDMQNDATLTTTGGSTTSSTTTRSSTERTSTTETNIQDNTAWALDLQSGWPMKNVFLTLNAAYYVWDNATFEGDTYFAEGGAMIGKWQGTLKYCVQDADEDDTVADSTGGIHYFVKEQNLRTGLEYRWGDSDDLWLLGLQFML